LGCSLCLSGSEFSSFAAFAAFSCLKQIKSQQLVKINLLLLKGGGAVSRQMPRLLGSPAFAASRRVTRVVLSDLPCDFSFKLFESEVQNPFILNLKKADKSIIEAYLGS